MVGRRRRARLRAAGGHRDGRVCAVARDTIGLLEAPRVSTDSKSERGGVLPDQDPGYRYLGAHLAVPL